MNKKKTLIPIVAIGALILSLLVVLPAFGAGTASFIDPGVITSANNGTLTDQTPPEQEYGRMGGPVGLYLDDDSLDVPIRRVLIPELDATMLTNDVSVQAHDNMIKATKGDNLTTDSYIAIGEHTVRKVTKLTTPTPTPVSVVTTSSAATTWNIDANPAIQNTSTTVVKDLGVSFTVTGFAANEAVALTVNSTSTPQGGTFPSAENLQIGVEGQPNLIGGANIAAENNTTGTLTFKAVIPVASDANTPREVGVTGANLGEYKYVFSFTSATVTTAKTHELTIYFYDDADGEIDVTLDAAFPEDITDEVAYVVNKLGSAATSQEVGWEDNYSKYAMAVLLDDDGNPGPQNVGTFSGLLRYRGDLLITAGNIASTNAAPATGATEAENRLERLTGNSTGRTGRDDVMVVRTTQTSGVWATSLTYTIDEVGDDSVVFDDDPQSTSAVEFNDDDDNNNYLIAWFDVPNDTGSSVTIRSDVYRTLTTVVLRETGESTGKFALEIKTTEFSDATDADDDQKMTMTEDLVPSIPVDADGRIVLASADSTATLRMETTAPAFSDLAPAHNDRGRSSRPEITAQVTDGGSGLGNGKKIDILFHIDEPTATQSSRTVVVNPSSDGDLDDISAGYEITGQLSGTDAPVKDATISWWIRAEDGAGNVGFSDQSPTKKNVDDICEIEDDGANETTIRRLMNNEMCDPYVFHVDSTLPTLERAETGRHWDTSIDLGDGTSKDMTEYRPTKANKSSILVVFSEHLEESSVSPSDFLVDGSEPQDAVVRNVSVRSDSEGGDGNPKYEDSSVISDTAGSELGYVFLTLSYDLGASDKPRVELKGAVMDLAGNERDSGRDSAALDRIAPTLDVSIDEGKRPAVMDEVNLTIFSDESIREAVVEFHLVQAYKDDEGKIKQTVTKSDDFKAKRVSSTHYTAVVKPSSSASDGLYTIYVTAPDTSSNVGSKGDKSDPVDYSSDTTAVLFELDNNIDDPDVDPGTPGIQSTFETDDQNAYIRIDFAAEGSEYDKKTYDHDTDGATDKVRGEDLDNHAGVTLVSATLNGENILDDNNLKSNDAGNTFQYKSPEPLEYGEHTLMVVARDVAGNQHQTSQKLTITVKERDPYSLDLNPGWNLVSLPGAPEDSDINVVIPLDRSDITEVITHIPGDPGQWLSAKRGADGLFAGTLKNITAERGYWMLTDDFKALNVSIPKQSAGEARILPTIRLATGWNLIPVLDVDGDFKLTTDQETKYLGQLGTDSRAYTFNTVANRWEQKTSVKLGVGYWVYVPKAAVLVP